MTDKPDAPDTGDDETGGDQSAQNANDQGSNGDGSNGDGSGGQFDFAYDAFISHATADKAEADRVVASLEARGLRCWIAPRDMRPGIEYGAEIINGIKRSKSLVVLLSSVSVTSRHVRAEVERAVDVGHTVYPVRLEDVEVGEALEFFLSIRQRIDVFNDPTDQNLKILADAIASDAAPEHVAVKTNVAPWRRWAIPAAFTAALVFGAVVVSDYIRSAMVMNQMTQQIEQAGVQAEAMRERMEAQIEEQNKPDLSKLKFAASPWGSGQFQVTIDPTQAMLHYTLRSHFLVDGEKSRRGSASFTTDGDFEKVEFVVENRDNERVDSRDVTALVRAALGAGVVAQLSEALARNDLLTCTIGGCAFKLSRFVSPCSPMIKEIAVRDGRKWKPLENLCPDPVAAQEQRIPPPCVDFAAFPMSLDPNEPISMRFTLATGETLEHDAALDPDRLRYLLRERIQAPSFDHWAVMQPIKERNPDGPAPLALLAYQPDQTTVGGFRLASGLQGCDASSNQAVARDGWLVDQDGKGLLRQSNGPTFGPVNRSFRGDEARPYVNGPLTVGIAADMADGERKGPYWYRIDPLDAVRLAAARNVASVECAMDRYGRNRAFTCRAKSRVGWIGARRIAFGPTADNLATVFDVDYSPADYLVNECGDGRHMCSPFEFTPPSEWTDVFYQVTEADGTATAVERVVIPQ